MGAEKREDIRWPLNSQEILKLNNILTWLWSKLHGDINFSDVQSSVRNQMFTYPLQFQGEDNLDATHPHRVWFYVPEDVSKIKKASLNAIVSRYRMDSSVAMSVPQQQYAAVVTGGASNVETTNSSNKTTAYVEEWGNPGTTIKHPRNQVTGGEQVATMDTLWDTTYPGAYMYEMTQDGSGDPLYVVAKSVGYQPFSELYYWTDLFKLQHYHNIDHYHLFPHTHSGSASISIDGHGHTLNEGIKESAQPAEIVTIYVNNGLVQTLGDGWSRTNIDILEHVKIGQWNVVEIRTNTLARITIYGIIELLQKVSTNSLY